MKNSIIKLHVFLLITSSLIVNINTQDICVEGYKVIFDFQGKGETSTLEAYPNEFNAVNLPFVMYLYDNTDSCILSLIKVNLTYNDENINHKFILN